MALYEIVNLGNMDPDYPTDEYAIRTWDADGNDKYFAGYDDMGSVNWTDTWSHEWGLSLEYARQYASDLEAADMPADPPRACAGYIIIQALRLDPSHEIVIGHNPRAAAPYVCWDCRNGDDYNTGGYCSTYRQALLVMSERLHDRYDYLPREYNA